MNNNNSRDNSSSGVNIKTQYNNILHYHLADNQHYLDHNEVETPDVQVCVPKFPL